MKIYQFEVRDGFGVSTHKIPDGYMSICSLTKYVGSISIIDSLKATAGLVEKGRYTNGNVRLSINPELGTYVEALDGSNRITKVGKTVMMVPEINEVIVVMTKA